MNTEYSEDQKQEETAFPVGEILKQARKKMGLSTQDVADRLKLRISVIKELEESSFENEQISTFTRGYIRSYAKFLGLNVDEILGNLKSVEQPSGNEQQMQSFSRKTTRDQDDSRVMHLTWVIFAIAVSITAFWWWQNLPSTSFQNTAEMEAEQASDLMYLETFDDLSAESELIENELTELTLPQSQQGAATSQSVATKQERAAQTISNLKTDSLNATLAEEKEEISVSSADVAKAAEKERAAMNGLSSVLMSFSDDCWIEVHDATGKRLVTGVRFAGEQLELTGKAPFSVVLGASSAVSLTYDGKNVDLSGYPSGRVVRLSLPKSS